MVVHLVLSKINKNARYKIRGFVFHTLVHPSLSDFIIYSFGIPLALITLRVHNNWQSNIIESRQMSSIQVKQIFINLIQINMSIDIQNIRNSYATISNIIKENQMNINTPALIDSSRVYAEKQVNKMVANQSYQHYQEVFGYINKYKELLNLIKQRSQGKMNSTNFKRKANQILNQNKIIPTEFSPERLALKNFFRDKNSKLMSNSNGLATILQNPSTPEKNFKKKRHEDGSQLESLINENKRLKEEFKNRQQNVEKNYEYTTTLQKNKTSIRNLQQQNSKLIRDNYKLKSQNSASVATQKQDVDDFLYSPYNFFTRRNNIHEINVRNMYSQGYDQSEIDNIEDMEEPSPQHHIIEKRVGYQYDTYSEQDYKKQRNVNYSVFDATKSYYSDQGDMDTFNNSKRYQNNKLLVRSKLAFFKEKGILYRNGDLQIGFKRSLPQNSDKVRVILYFNNKSPDYRTVRIDYQYEQDYYEVIVSEKIRQIEGLKQGRQVVEVTLRGNRPDFNSLIDVIITVGYKQYKFILPAMFIKIEKSGSGSSQEQGSKSFYPIKQLSNGAQAKKIIPELQTLRNNEGQIWCESIKGNGILKMIWKQDKGKLEIRTSRRWLQFWSFLFLDSS